jgi:hypothetical protein
LKIDSKVQNQLVWVVGTRQLAHLLVFWSTNPPYYLLQFPELMEKIFDEGYWLQFELNE